jgi:predicted DNA-binding transcriptional regulator YafY
MSLHYHRNMRTLKRLSMVSKLIKARKMNARQIAERLHDSRRNIHRDIFFLRHELKHQIEVDRYGYFYRSEPLIVLGL